MTSTTGPRFESRWWQERNFNILIFKTKGAESGIPEFQISNITQHGGRPGPPPLAAITPFLCPYLKGWGTWRSVNRHRSVFPCRGIRQAWPAGIEPKIWVQIPLSLVRLSNSDTQTLLILSSKFVRFINHYNKFCKIKKYWWIHILNLHIIVKSVSSEC